MTWVTTNNKCLKLGISSKFDQLQNISLTQTSCHDNASLKFFLQTSSPILSHFTNLSLATKLKRPLFHLSHWSPKHMVHYNLPLLIIIPGIHITLHAFVTSRSLVILIKPCLILLKFVFQYIATLYLFYHCISMFVSYALCIKT